MIAPVVISIDLGVAPAAAQARTYRVPAPSACGCGYNDYYGVQAPFTATGTDNGGGTTFYFYLRRRATVTLTVQYPGRQLRGRFLQAQLDRLPPAGSGSGPHPLLQCFGGCCRPWVQPAAGGVDAERGAGPARHVFGHGRRRRVGHAHLGRQAWRRCADPLDESSDAAVRRHRRDLDPGGAVPARSVRPSLLRHVPLLAVTAGVTESAPRR
jgi:hypothetical protein